MKIRVSAGIVAALVIAGATAVRADRTVLAPTGDTLSPGTYRAEFALDPEGRVQDRVWLQYSTPQGIELETERYDLTNERKKGYALNIQYPLTYSLTNTIPAVSLGVRDLTGTGNEHGAFYAAATRNISLSERQHRLVDSLKLDAGIGSGRIGGLFAGLQMRLNNGLRIQAEIYRRQPNVSVAMPLTRQLDVRAYSLDSHFYYGLSYSIRR
ncbi:MAG TPA: YjbH domain-containing protein [Chthonomonadaceae bacterium]|nr:YjbH domain-containing protein [Chthonomonadaceae bacterium]